MGFRGFPFVNRKGKSFRRMTRFKPFAKRLAYSDSQPDLANPGNEIKQQYWQLPSGAV